MLYEINRSLINYKCTIRNHNKSFLARKENISFKKTHRKKILFPITKNTCVCMCLRVFVYVLKIYFKWNAIEMWDTSQHVVKFMMNVARLVRNANCKIVNDGRMFDPLFLPPINVHTYIVVSIKASLLNLSINKCQ